MLSPTQPLRVVPFAVLAVVLALLPPATVSAAAPALRPNIVFFLADDKNYNMARSLTNTP